MRKLLATFACTISAACSLPTQAQTPPIDPDRAAQRLYAAFQDCEYLVNYVMTAPQTASHQLFFMLADQLLAHQRQLQENHPELEDLQSDYTTLGAAAVWRLYAPWTPQHQLLQRWVAVQRGLRALGGLVPAMMPPDTRGWPYTVQKAVEVQFSHARAWHYIGLYNVPLCPLTAAADPAINRYAALERWGHIAGAVAYADPALAADIADRGQQFSSVWSIWPLDDRADTPHP